MKNKYCKSCILHSGMFNIQIGDNGNCFFCDTVLNSKDNQKLSYTKNCLELFSQAIETSKSNFNNNYNIAVALSGGKDSSYVLYLLKEKYKVKKIVAVSVIHPFLNKLAIQNIEKVTRKLDVDLIKLDVGEYLFKKVIKKALTEENKYILLENVGCLTCGAFRKWALYYFALNNKIPFIANGLDKSILREKDYYIHGDELKGAILKTNYYVRDLMFIQKAGGTLIKNTIYEYSPEYYLKGSLPDIFSPIAIGNYSKNKIVKELDENNLLNPAESDPEETNCKLNQLFAYFSFKNYNCYIFQRLISRELRAKAQGDFIEYLFKTKNIPERFFKRDFILKIIEEYKKTIFFIAENKNVNDKQIEVFCNKLDYTLKLIGREKLIKLVKQYHYRLHYYADYLNINLG